MLATRQGFGGRGKIHYLPSFQAINLSNKAFGFDGWSCQVVRMSREFTDRSKEGRWTVGTSAIVRVSIRGGSYHEGIGFGTAENMKSLYGAVEKSYKEAVSDARKRALRMFGHFLGNCIYDKSHTAKVQADAVKMRREKRRLAAEAAATATTTSRRSSESHSLASGFVPPDSALTASSNISPPATNLRFANNDSNSNRRANVREVDENVGARQQQTVVGRASSVAPKRPLSTSTTSNNAMAHSTAASESSTKRPRSKEDPCSSDFPRFETASGREVVMSKESRDRAREVMTSTTATTATTTIASSSPAAQSSSTSANATSKSNPERKTADVLSDGEFPEFEGDQDIMWSQIGNVCEEAELVRSSA